MEMYPFSCEFESKGTEKDGAVRERVTFAKTVACEIWQEMSMHLTCADKTTVNTHA